MKKGDRVILQEKIPYDISSNMPKIQYYPPLEYIDIVKTINNQDHIKLKSWYLGNNGENNEAIFLDVEFEIVKQ